MGEAIVVTSGKGGVGKTTTTANIGTALALSGKKVCLIDTDIGLRNLDVVMGLENRIIYDLVDVVQKNCKTHQALIKDKRFDELYVLPAAQTKDKSAVDPEDLKALIFELKADFDYILIDCPAGIEQGFKNAVAGADQAIVVTTPEVSSVRDADRIIGLLEQEAHVHTRRMVVNRIRNRMVESGEAMDVDEIVTILAIDLLGIVPDDDQVIKSSNNGDPIVMDPKLKPSIAYRNIARRINGESIPLMSLEEEDSGMFGKMKKMFGMKR
ncbi:septum site-determining protein MinD [Salisediminibacterium halotolerans]|uniref:Septum site-determining protein MinD n=1 Tax=Salisediminibacterium halotolerans TaxID=517425 RepID=A0A1H9R4C7_9BACI|nr:MULTISPECIES: septum site-determining protein MinD [Salisediminibacterium]RLJ78218.1 septum site-determining protein MinD [Actinophytocola xinjiangensis]RPE88443.1 septum site-determining protein MinD [Salisediminibacterium halotolerans]TWG37195.1 septum site-determining protein MinD [Salisediminibacterium halotolerans]SER66899.1 septum site-determining protein MinD [Salisediminibacterium haloalkalitolerans]GEL07129.1 septum site-determining protein MinD [Salisediminibacterium halotolerans]